MRQRQQRCLVRVRIVLIAPRINMGRRNDDRRIAEIFEPVDELERDFLKPGERELIVVELGTIAPRDDTGDAVVEMLGEYDDALVVELRDVDRPARVGGIGRVGIHHLAVGDADEIGAELARLVLDLHGGDFLTEDFDHLSLLDPPRRVLADVV
jgi:hypothetical protein